MSNSLLALALLALACLGPALCQHPRFVPYFELADSYETPTDELLARLRQPFTVKYSVLAGSVIRGSTRRQVASVLGEAYDKRSKILVDKFSVDDLLALNMCRLDDCSRAELTRRDEICSFLERGKEANPVKDESEESIGQVYKNLYDYSNYAVIACHRWCVEEREKVAEKAVKRLSFTEAVKVRGVQTLVNWPNDDGRALTVEERDRKIKEVYEQNFGSEKLKSACQSLIGIMQSLVQFKEDKKFAKEADKGKWEEAYEYCQVLVGLYQ